MRSIRFSFGDADFPAFQRTFQACGEALGFDANSLKPWPQDYREANRYVRLELPPPSASKSHYTSATPDAGDRYEEIAVYFVPYALTGGKRTSDGSDFACVRVRYFPWDSEDDRAEILVFPPRLQPEVLQELIEKIERP